MIYFFYQIFTNIIFTNIFTNIIFCFTKISFSLSSPQNELLVANILENAEPQSSLSTCSENVVCFTLKPEGRKHPGLSEQAWHLQ